MVGRSSMRMAGGGSSRKVEGGCWSEKAGGYVASCSANPKSSA